MLVTQSCLTLVTPWTVAHQALSLGFARQEYWRRVPCPSPGEFSWPRDWTWLSHIAGSFFTREGQLCIRLIPNSRKQKKTDFHSMFVLRSRCFWIPLQSLWRGIKQANWTLISVTWLKFPHFNVSFFLLDNFTFPPHFRGNQLESFKFHLHKRALKLLLKGLKSFLLPCWLPWKSSLAFCELTF